MKPLCLFSRPAEPSLPWKNALPPSFHLLLCLLLAFPALSATNYVWLESPNPTPPFSSWAMAATTIQDAIDAAAPGDVVLVTNGVYATGGKALHGTMTNRVTIDKAITPCVSCGNPRQV